MVVGIASQTSAGTGVVLASSTGSIDEEATQGAPGTAGCGQQVGHGAVGIGTDGIGIGADSLVDGQHVVAGALSTSGCGIVTVAICDSSWHTSADTLIIGVETSIALYAAERITSTGNGAIADSVGNAVGHGISGLKTEVGSASGTSVD